MAEILPCLWSDRRAAEAALVPVRPGPWIGPVPGSAVDAYGGKAGRVLAFSATLAGQPVLALTGCMLKLDSAALDAAQRG